MSPPRLEVQVLPNPQEENIRRLFRIRIFQIFVFAVTEALLCICVSFYWMEDEKLDFFWPEEYFFPPISWEMFTQVSHRHFVLLL